MRSLLSLIYPSFCNHCNWLIPQNSIFCDNCEQKIKPITSTFVPITKNRSIKVFAVSDYKQPLRSLILKKSYSQILASKLLARIIMHKTPIKNLSFDFIVPIPLHWTRYAWRGYNQSYVMAKVLSENLQVPVLNILKRKKRTVFQSKLPKEKRILNVKNVFDLKFRYKSCNANFLKNKTILLVDDLCTTGATLKNAARVLFDFKSKEIIAIVACRVL